MPGQGPIIGHLSAALFDKQQKERERKFRHD